MDTPNSAAPAAPQRLVMPPAWDMVKDAWRWYNARLRPLLMLSLIIGIPTIVLSVLNLYKNVPVTTLASLNPFAWVGISIVSVLLGIFTMLWSMNGTIALYTYVQHPDEHQAPWKLFVGSWSKMRTFFTTNLLYGLIIIGGVILLIIPGIWWAVLFSLAPLITLIEKLPATAALKRSKALISGYWFDVFWRGLLLGLTIVAVSLVISIGLTVIDSALSLINDRLGDFTIVVDDFVSVALMPLNALLTFRIYEILKKRA